MYIFIVNPAAGNGRGRKTFEHVQRLEIYKKMETLEFITAYKGHAEKITREIVDNVKNAKIKALIIIGGDGTMQEVLSGLSHHEIPISFIAAGSGNDFFRGSQLPKRAKLVLENLMKNEQERPYWLGSFQSNDIQRTFATSIGFGFDAVVANRANRSLLKKILNLFHLGKLIYVYALIREIFAYEPFTVKVKVDETIETFEKCFMLTVNNQPYFGGGMKINPLAKNEKDYFSILVVDSISKWKVLFLFMTVFSGKHIDFKEVKVYRGKQISIQTDKLSLFQVDGEIGRSNECNIKKQPYPLRVKGGYSSTYI